MEQDEENGKNAEKHNRRNRCWREADKIRALNYEKDLLQYLIQRIRILDVEAYPQLRNSLVELGANPKLFPESIPSSEAFERWKEQTVLKGEERITVINNQLPGSTKRSVI